MCKVIGILILLMDLLSSSILAFGQITTFQPSPYVFKIKASNCIHQPTTRTQTGFRVDSVQGIVTALHGVIGCGVISAQPGGNGATYRDLIIVKVDISRDTALLWSESLGTAPMVGLKTVANPQKGDFTGVKVIGYPLDVSKQSIMDVKVAQQTYLGDLLPVSKIEAVAERDSPSIDIKVLSVQSALVPGHSGAPLLTSDGRVIAIADGGLDLGRVDMAWAIPWNAIQWKTVSPKISQDVSQSDVRRLTNLAKLDPKLTFSLEDPSVDLPILVPITFHPISIISIANASTQKGYVAPPLGKMKLGGIPFDLPLGFNSVTTQAEGLPNNPTRLSLTGLSVESPKSVHMLITGGATRLQFAGKTIGKVRLYFQNSQQFTIDIVPGKNIREWKTYGTHNVTSASDVIEVWHGDNTDDSSDGVIDMLSIRLPGIYSTDILTAIEILDLSMENFGSMNPAINLIGITVETN